MLIIINIILLLFLIMHLMEIINVYIDFLYYFYVMSTRRYYLVSYSKIRVYIKFYVMLCYVTVNYLVYGYYPKLFHRFDFSIDFIYLCFLFVNLIIIIFSSTSFRSTADPRRIL